MASTMPSATAWLARSALDQWVMCSPLATGSRQASSTIWALCRGGNLLGASLARVVQQELPQPALFVAAADPPHSGTVALQAGGQGFDTLPGGDGQDDAGMLDLKPSQVATASHGLEDGDVRRQDGQRAGSSTAHEGASQKGPSS